MNLGNQLYDELVEEYKECELCPIGTRAKAHVLGKGHFRPQVVFIGEGPGKLEDIKGQPFIGQAGQLLREAVRCAAPDRPTLPNEPFPVKAFFTNLVACRPCDRVGGPNRPPSSEEISNCADRLRRLVTMLTPRVVVLLGAVARDSLGKQDWIKNYRLFFLQHPAYILRHGGKGTEVFGVYVERMKEVVHACLQPA